MKSNNSSRKPNRWTSLTMAIVFALLFSMIAYVPANAQVSTGSITIEVDSNPDGGTGFGFTDNIAAPNSFNLDEGQSKTFSNLEPGSYTITATTLPAGWVVAGRSCSGGQAEFPNPGNSIVIDLEAGQNISCKFTYYYMAGTITIEKKTEPGGGTGFDFTDNIIAPNSFSLDDGQSKNFSDVMQGIYTITETLPPDWVRLSTSCSGGSATFPANGVTIDLKPRDHVTCTFTNRSTTSNLEVIKSVDWKGIPPDNSQTFEICISGPSYPDGDCKTTDYDGGSLAWFDITPGAYTVSETDPGSPWEVTISGSPAAVEDGRTTQVEVSNVNNTELDYGDAPDPLGTIEGEYPTLLANNGARHVLSGPKLGANRDAETDGLPTANADGDNTNGIPDDEEGVIFTSNLTAGYTTDVTINVSSGGYLEAWVDFDSNGSWSDASEQIFSNQSVNAGNNDLTFSVPLGASPGTTYARFRLSTDGGLSPSGFASDGEVEDYQVSILLDPDPPTVVSTDLLPSYNTGPTSFEITFSENVSTIGGSAGSNSATNPANYLLLKEGLLAGFQTSACGSTDLVNDTKINVNSVTYDSVAFTAAVNINNGAPLPEGSYRLLVCGTTSIEDPATNTLAGDGINPGTDFVIDFVITTAEAGSLPSTGFPKGRITTLASQPASKAYTSTKLLLKIPALNVTLPIIGIPRSGDSWDVTWLGTNAGWLSGSAFPTWAGNTVLTGHVWDAYNQPGPFAEIKDLAYGDQMQIYTSWGSIYTYEVRENKVYWSNSAVSKVFEHKEFDWITLLTCETYNPLNNNYLFRRIVRAVLVNVE